MKLLMFTGWPWSLKKVLNMLLGMRKITHRRRTWSPYCKIAIAYVRLVSGLFKFVAWTKESYRCYNKEIVKITIVFKPQIWGIFFNDLQYHYMIFLHHFCFTIRCYCMLYEKSPQIRCFKLEWFYTFLYHGCANFFCLTSKL